MRIDSNLTDIELLRELGGRLTSARLARNLTQAALAEEAGVSKRTLERLESGEVATQLSSFIRVCRALGMVEQFESIVPATTPGPVAQLKLAGRQRQRAQGKRGGAVGAAGARESGVAGLAAASKKWTWGEK